MVRNAFALVLALAGTSACHKPNAAQSDASPDGEGPGRDDAPADAPPDTPTDARLDAMVLPDAHPDAAPPVDAAPDAPVGPDLWQGIYDEVDPAHLNQLIREMSGDLPVTVNGVTYSITERFSDEGRKKFRDYWTQSMTDLGLSVQELDFTAAARPGQNLEAVLPGPSADSYVIIVHYDSIGPFGHETANPGADDDMSGMAIQLETARILVAHKDQLGVTVRFVASDEEELGGLAGARAYASYIKDLSTMQGFQLVGAIDDEQTGWNCKADNACAKTGTLAFEIFACGPGGTFNFNAYGNQFSTVVHEYSPLRVARACMGENSDHYAMWEIGVPTIVFSENDPFDNPHFDQEGDDTISHIDFDYHALIARAAITFQAGQAGIPRFGPVP